jgi:energy-coupling factor transporter ATP-binding protein EcfA2
MPYRYDVGTWSSKEGTDGPFTLGKSALGEPYSIDLRSLIFHKIILGRTGTGKSNLLLNLCKNILKVIDNNLVIVDFHGSLASEIISMNSTHDLIYIGTGPERDSKKIRLNILKGASESSISLYLIQEIFSRESSLSGGTWGPRLQTIFTAILKEIILLYPEATLDLFMQTLLSREKMKILSQKCSEDSKAVIANLISRWQSWTEYSASSINKLYPIVSDKDLRDLTCSPNESFDVISALEEGGKLIVVDVSKTKYSATQGKIISSLILNRFWTEILKKGEIPNTAIIVDEAQNLNSKVLSEILSEGRKFNLFLTVASQYLDQYDRELKGSLLSNCGSLYSFNISEKDAREVCSVLTERRKRVSAMKSILLGSPHNVTHLNFLSSSGIKVESFTPDLFPLQRFPSKTDNIIRGSLEKFGTGDDSTPKDVVSIIKEHDYLENFFQRYLEDKHIIVEKEKKLNNLRPDLHFFLQNKPIFVEIEVSDLEKFDRILEKACNFSGQKLIFLCPKDKGKLLREKLTDTAAVSKYLGILRNEGKQTFVDYMNILIIEERGGNVYYVEKTKLKRFNINHLFFSYSFMLREDIDNTSFLLSNEIMKNEHRHYITKGEVLLSLGGKSDILNSYIQDDRIIISDFFN